MKVITTERIPIKLWLDNMEEGALAQARNLANLKVTEKWVAIMPDSHQGYGMPIGGVIATQQVIIPNAVGVDIGCGMVAAKLSITELDTNTIKHIMEKIRETIPVGFNHHKVPQEWSGFDYAPDIPIIQHQLPSARKQLGTLGGGNHFIEIQKGDDGHIYVMVHSGSRNFGYKIANTYHKIAVKLCERWRSDIPNKDLSFLPMETKEGKEYYEAMKYAMTFAHANRQYMLDQILAIFHSVTKAYSETYAEEIINVHHNYAAFEHHFKKNYLIHRKGAILAAKDMRGIIPGSMGTPSYITIGLGNSESFMSCSHGAGRIMGRKEAIRSLDLSSEQERMKGIIHGLRNEKDLDEAPGAYKDINTVMKNQRDLVAIKTKLTPLASIKG